MKILRALGTILSGAEKYLLVLLLSLMVVMAFLQVLLRNIFHSGLIWVDPLLRHLVLWVGFLGASVATREEKHIHIDLLTRFLPPKATNIVRIATNLFAAGVCAVLSEAGATFLANEFASQETLFTIGSTDFRTWWFQTIIPAGFGLLALRFLFRAADHVIRAVRGDVTAAPEMNVPTIEPR